MKNLFLKHIIFLLCFFVAGCTTYNIESYYDDFKKIKMCVLRDCFLGEARHNPLRGYYLKIQLEKSENSNVLASFMLLKSYREADFKPIVNILFKLENVDNTSEEMRLASIGPVQRYRYDRGTNMSLIEANMTPEQIVKIAQAEKVTIFFETLQNPIIFDLAEKKLEPLREFVRGCLAKK